ncbi:STAS domain-containing protein [Brevibacillus migulae]|uniref:STAS domain-containing protein n=1 Tax=Brevibacillus migulae TaxID=1644114 RepID=UPI00106DF7DA|nr:STAS domain-containing protein [Brevibacillus migulae]
MKLEYTENQDFLQFYTANQDAFYELLTLQGRKFIQKMEGPEKIDLEFILTPTRKVVLLLNERNEHGLIMHAKEHGERWARNNLDLLIKLEWIQMLRITYWEFLFHYYKNIELSRFEFFQLEHQVNFNLDTYLKHFASSYSMYKNEVLQSQREVIADLSVPVIPLSDHVALLPIVGTLDTLRAKKIQEHVLLRIYQLKIQTIIMDLSSVTNIDTAIVPHLFTFVNGVALQGCKAVITGIRPEITKAILELGISLHEKVETRGTLQQAFAEYVK